MLFHSTDAIGDRGETIFKVKISERHGSLPLFWAAFLGEKWPTADFFVELVGNKGPRMFFLASVKATCRGLDKRHRLRVVVSAEHVRRLHRYAAPTYIVGVDELSERAYIVSANGEAKGRLASLSTKYLLDADTRLMLRDEVASFWKSHKKKVSSSFVDKSWR